MENKLIFYVNGERISLTNPPLDKTLLDFLRNDLGLSGTKYGCGEGTCGACTVTLARKGPDGVIYSAINACYTKICSLQGTSITTSEGLAQDKNTLHPIQERLVKSHGVQCGYCSPGMIMSMHARLMESEKRPVADIEDIVQTINGNLCRCTGYRPIIEAFQTFCSKKDGSSALLVDSGCKEFDPKRDDPKVPEEVMASELSGQFLEFEDEKTGKKWFRPTTLSELLTLQKTHATFRKYLGGTGGYKMGSWNECDVTVQLNGIAELKCFKDELEFWNFGAGLTLSDMLAIFKNIIEDTTGRSKGELSLAAAYAKALESIGSPQLRNVASIGGSIFYTHPCSDLMPIHFVCGAKIEIQTRDGTTRVLDLDEEFCNSTAEKLQASSDVVTKLFIMKPPRQSDTVVGFFRKARRKTFDLAILNAAFYLKQSRSKLDFVRIAFGGTDQVFQSPPEWKGPRMALHSPSLLSSGLLNIDEKLMQAICKDVPVTAGSPGSFGVLRQALAFTFTKDIFDEVTECRPTSERKFYQIFKQVSPDQPECDLVERPVPHLWADELAKGSGLYTNDVTPLKTELSAVLIRSTVAHGEISKLDFSEALTVQGVEAVVSADDLTGDQNLWGISGVCDEEIFASKKVVHHGQVVAALLCSDLKAGKRAAQKVVVEYKELPFILGIREERRKGTDLNSLESFGGEFQLKRFQDESLLAKAGLKKITGSMSIGRQDHAYMEPHAAVVIPLGEKDEYVCYYTTQEPTTVQKCISSAIGIPRHKITVKTRRVGGAFGGKERLLPALIAAVGAKKTGRPVRCVLSRSEDMEMTGHRHEVLVDYEVDVDSATGQIIHCKFKAFSNAGHSTDLSVPWISSILLRIDGGYTLKNFEGTGRAIKTNVPSNTAMRGFGGPEGAIFIEEIINRIAYETGLDANQIREINMTRENDLLHHGNTPVQGCTLQRCWKECLEKSKFAEKIIEVKNFNIEHSRKKRGISMMPIKFAPSFFFPSPHQATAYVRIFADGTVIVSHGGIEMGQGLHTKMIQVASRVLGIDPKNIYISETSTETVANSSPTGGSTGSDMNGVAVIKACEVLMERLEPYKLKDPEGKWSDWVLKAHNDRVNLSAVGFYDSSNVSFNPPENSGTSFDYHVFGAGCVEVEVDCNTGDVTVLSAHIVMDVGKSLNPAIDIGQIEGAFVQVIGYATTEQLIVSTKDGKLLTNNFGTYKIPTAMDIPNQISVTLLDNDEATHTSAVFSSKGIGEPPSLLVGAIVSAIREALTSYRKDQGLSDWFDMSVPLTADKIRLLAKDDVVELALKNVCQDTIPWAVEI